MSRVQLRCIAERREAPLTRSLNAPPSAIGSDEELWDCWQRRRVRADSSENSQLVGEGHALGAAPAEQGVSALGWILSNGVESMGSISAYDTAAGRRYRVRYRTPGRQQTDKRGFRTKREADLYLASLEVAKARGDYVSAARAGVTFATWSEKWIESLVQVKPSTLQGYVSITRGRLQPRWGSTPLNAITHSDVQSWISDENSRVGARTVRSYHRVFSMIVKYAVRDGRLVAKSGRRHPAASNSPQEASVPDARAIARTGRSVRLRRPRGAVPGLHRPALGRARRAGVPQHRLRAPPCADRSRSRRTQ